MLKKTIASVSIIFVFGVAVVPFIPGNDCGKMCCDINTNTHSMIEMARGCSISLNECDPGIFLPLLSAPLAKFQQVDDLTFTMTIPIEEFVPIKFNIYLLISQIPEPDSHPTHLTPLLI